MNCPKCKGYILKPKKHENGLISLSCDKCHGGMLSIIHYIDWSKKNKNNVTSDNEIHKIDETKQLINCPKCFGFMTKYKISNQTHNRLDLCFRCYEIWIDSGEWQLLQQLELDKKLPNIFSQEWQKNIVTKEMNEKRLKRYENYFGNDFEKIAKFKNWLDNYDKKSNVIHFLK